LADLAGILNNITHLVARHAYAALALNKGIPVEVVQKLPSHSEIQTNQIYTKVPISTTVKEMEKIGPVKRN